MDFKFEEIFGIWMEAQCIELANCQAEEKNPMANGLC